MTKTPQSINPLENLKAAAVAEWRRLNPVYVQAGDALPVQFLNSARETLPGFFAPLRMLAWVVRTGIRSVWQVLKK